MGPAHKFWHTRVVNSMYRPLLMAAGKKIYTYKSKKAASLQLPLLGPAGKYRFMVRNKSILNISGAEVNVYVLQYTFEGCFCAKLTPSSRFVMLFDKTGSRLLLNTARAHYPRSI